VTDYLGILPREGVCGRLYLYLRPQAPPIEREQWSVMTWDGKKYHTHGPTVDSLEKLKVYAGTLLWAKDWCWEQCTATNHEENPCVRVEFQYQDGRVQRLTGNAANKWLSNVNGIVSAAQFRYGQSQMKEHPWEFSRKDD